MDADYFFDTYALIEFVEGNNNYERFNGEPVITSLYNIYEFTYYLLSGTATGRRPKRSWKSSTTTS